MFGARPTTQPNVSIVTVAEQKSHMRLLGRDSNDADVLAYLLFAEEYVSSITNHAFQPRQYTYTLDRPPNQYGFRWLFGGAYGSSYGSNNAQYTNSIELPIGPLITVDTVSYKTQDPTTGAYVETVMPSTAYQVSTTQVPGRIRPVTGGYWPFSSLFALEGMTITFTAGYTTNVPQRARMAIKMLAAYQYENREPMVNGNVVGNIPFTLKNLLNNLKESGFC